MLIGFGLDAEFGLNGIEYHPAGYLILASPGTGQLIRVAVDNPQRWELIDLDVRAAGVDGIVWTADGSLV